jgi:ABC-type transporter Mla subunit MlaD
MHVHIFRYLALGLLIIGSLLGCQESPLTLSIRYSALDNLKADAAVYFYGIRIGQIEKITSTQQGDYLVIVSIDPQHKQYITEYSHFFISNDPLQQQDQVLIVEQDQPGGTMLENNSIIQGERKTFLEELKSSLQKTGEQATLQLEQTLSELKVSLTQGSKQLDQQLDESLTALNNSLRDLAVTLQKNTPDEQELEQLQQTLNDFIAQFKLAEEEVRQQLKETIIPQIQQQLKELKQRTKEEEKKKELMLMEVKIEQFATREVSSNAT